MRKIAVLACSIALFASAQQSQPPSPTPREIRRTDQQGAKNTISAAENGNPTSASGAGVGEHRTERGEHPKNKQNETPTSNLNDIVVALATVVIALATIAQAVIYAKQTGYMKTALSETTKAANAAKASADSIMSSERAWMTITDILEGSGASLPPGFYFNILNGGKTPARINGLVLVCESIPVTQKLPPVPDYTAGPRHLFGGDSGHEPLLIPEGRLHARTGTPFPPNIEFGPIYTEVVRIYAYGFLTYIDSFEREHTLRFGYMYLPFRPEQRRSQWAIIPLREYNQQN